MEEVYRARIRGTIVIHERHTTCCADCRPVAAPPHA